MVSIQAVVGTAANRRPLYPPQTGYPGDVAQEAPQLFHAKQYNTTDGLFWGSPGTANALDSGFYEPLSIPGIGPALRKMAISTDDLIRLPDPTCDMLLKEFVDFWSCAGKLKSRGLAVKRGLLLWGPPGSGKTSALQLMAHHMVKEMGGIVVMASQPHTTAQALSLVRSIEPERPIITLFEDLDAMVANYGEPGILALLDGELQISGVVNVACPAPETLILTADLTWVRADSLQPGDELIAFDEDGPDRKYRTAQVRSAPLIEKPRFRVTTSGGAAIVVSERHPFLVKPGEFHAREWRMVEDLKPGNLIASIGRPWETDTSWGGGYLSGQYDGEGCLNIQYGSEEQAHRGFRAHWAQASGPMVDEVEALLTERGFIVNKHKKTQTGQCKNGDPWKPQHQLTIGGGRWGSLRLLGTIRPRRLLAHPRLFDGWEGARLRPLYEEVVSIEPVGDGPVVALDTTTKTFIGDGLLQHNTTNYPEYLDPRFIDRPGRFDRITFVDMPLEEARRAYFAAKAHDVDEDLRERWVRASDGWSLAHLRELVVAHLALGEPDEDVIERMNEMREDRPKSDKAPGREFGFGGNVAIDRLERQLAGANGQLQRRR